MTDTPEIGSRKFDFTMIGGIEFRRYFKWSGSHWALDKIQSRQNPWERPEIVELKTSCTAIVSDFNGSANTKLMRCAIENEIAAYLDSKVGATIVSYSVQCYTAHDKSQKVRVMVIPQEYERIMFSLPVSLTSKPVINVILPASEVKCQSVQPILQIGDTIHETIRNNRRSS